MANRVQISEVLFTGDPGNRVQISEVTFTTAAAPVLSLRVQISEVTFTGSGPDPTNRVQISEVRFTAAPMGAFLWDGPGTDPYPVDVHLWDGTTLAALAI